MELTGCGRRTSRLSYLRAFQLVTTPNPAVQRTGGIAALAHPAADRNVRLSRKSILFNEHRSRERREFQTTHLQHRRRVIPQPSIIDIAKAPVIAYNEKDWNAVRAAVAHGFVYDEVATDRRPQGVNDVLAVW
jgi:hypothetical protein